MARVEAAAKKLAVLDPLPHERRRRLWQQLRPPPWRPPGASNAPAKRFPGRGQPVIAVDTKQQEWIGNFANAGREWQPRGQPEQVPLDAC